MPKDGRRIRVLIVDDSLVTRSVLRRALDAAPDMDVVGAASDAISGRDMLVGMAPDVMTLDIEMPAIDGLTLLRAVMRHRPTPVVIVSSRSTHGSEAALAALAAGAVDVLPKPTDAEEVGAFTHQYVEAVRRAARASVRGGGAVDAADAPTRAGTATEGGFQRGQLIGLVASTGGTEALCRVLQGLPTNAPPIVIVQHIAPAYVVPFAERLARTCNRDVRRGEEDELLEPGCVRIAPGDTHLVVAGTPSLGYRTKLRDGPRVLGQRPSGDVLLRSVARIAGRHAVGAVLTGMGEDGAEGLLAMREAGGRTFAQDLESCVVYGMPRAAMTCGAAERSVPLAEMADAIVGVLKRA